MAIDTEIRPDTEQAPAVNAPNNPPVPTNKETVPSDLTVEKSTVKSTEKPVQKAPVSRKSAAKPKPPKAEKAAKPSKAADKKSPAKKGLRPRNSRPNRKTHRARVKKRKLYISIFPNFTPSKTIRSKYVTMMKWRQWWKVSRIRE